MLNTAPDIRSDARAALQLPLAAIAHYPGTVAVIHRDGTPSIMADAAWHVLTRDSRATSGNFFIDDEVLASAGITDLSVYAVQPGAALKHDLFVD